MIYYKGLFFQAAKVGIEICTAKIVIKKTRCFKLKTETFLKLTLPIYRCLPYLRIALFGPKAGLYCLYTGLHSIPCTCLDHQLQGSSAQQVH
jgi:hypothetical protein